MLFLAGDVGGTKTNLALFKLEEDGFDPVCEKNLPTQQYDSLSELLLDFQGQSGLKTRHALLGIAGPVKRGRVKAPNLPWEIEQQSLEREIGFEKVELINDLVANAHGISALERKDLLVLQPGDALASGNVAVISVGTGIGEAGLFWDGQQHMPFASEGGHVNFAPADHIQNELLLWRRRELAVPSASESPHVSYDEFLSGRGIFNIYRFLRDRGTYTVPGWLEHELEQSSDQAETISRAALDMNVEICHQTLDIFIAIYGSEAGNLALKKMATGGIYVGGGIAPRILAKMREPIFLEAFLNKGPMRELLKEIPVQLIMNDKAALLGAAQAGRRLFRHVACSLR